MRRALFSRGEETPFMEHTAMMLLHSGLLASSKTFAFELPGRPGRKGSLFPTDGVGASFLRGDFSC